MIFYCERTASEIRVGARNGEERAAKTSCVHKDV